MTLYLSQKKIEGDNMNVKTFSLSVVLTMTFLGCGGDDTASCRFEVQQNLDKGDFTAVIAELSNASSTCRSAYTGNEWQIDLGAAYMGEAGFGISDLISLIGVEDAGATSSYGTFVDRISQQQSDTALNSLDNAKLSYVAALNGTACTDPSLTNSEQDICLYTGLADTMLATTTLNYLLDDISALFDNNSIAQADAKEDMKASMCALEFLNQASTCADASSVTAVDVPFTYSDDSVKTFSDVSVVINGNTYHRLGTEASVVPGTTIVTDGYCMDDFSMPSPTYSVNSRYACPLNQDPNVDDRNVTTLLVETLNGGLDSLESVFSGDVTLQQDIIDYRNDIDNLGNSDGTITVDEIQDYLITL